MFCYGVWTLLISNYCCFETAISSTLVYPKITLSQIHSKLLNTDLATVDRIVVIEEEQGQKTPIYWIHSAQVCVQHFGINLKRCELRMN